MSEPSSQPLLPRSPRRHAPAPPVAGRARLALVWEVVTGGVRELWAHKLRSILTLTLLMLGVFALVVMTSVLDGVKDKVATGFAGMSWDGTHPDVAARRQDLRRAEALRHEPGLALRRPGAPHRTAPAVLGFSPRATKRSSVRAAGGTERIFVTGVSSDYSTS